MADLDDFFAKKDKKKKGTKKFSQANTEVIAKNLEETAIKEQLQQDKDITNIGDEMNPENVNQQLSWISRQFKLNSKDETDDDEWDDYRENKKDYTGLKIETLVIEDVEKPAVEEETEVNENGEVVKKEESGPWNKKDGERSNSSEAESPVVESKPLPGAAVVMEQPNVVGGAYVPPGARNREGGGPSSAVEARKPPRRMKAAPDISSAINFPSLSSAAEDTAPKGAWGKKLVRDEAAFEEVRGDYNSKNQNHRSSDGPKLTLGNKFDALRDE